LSRDVGESAGHTVVGLARLEAAAAPLASAGAEVHRSSLDDPESLAAGARAAEGVIHTAFIRDFANYAAAAEADRRAIERGLPGVDPSAREDPIP
jgi:uncharacterized protein YbjT (DUF2867 family)